jgi:hypothetical protein
MRRIGKLKKIFHKINKIVFVVGMISLLVLVLIVMNSSSEVIDGVWGTLGVICLLNTFLFLLFVVISAILVVVEGLKTDKVALFKKYRDNVIWMTIVYTVPTVMDCFYEAALPESFELGNMVLRILLTALAIMGGEYMIADHSKEDEDELHF